MPSMAFNFGNSLTPYNNPPVPEAIIPASGSSTTTEDESRILDKLIQVSNSNNISFS